jgi:hypothetical protein
MQARFNQSTRSHWQHFAAHRAQVEQLLLPDCSHPAGRLCVLGAGNCNDLDLPRLAERFDEIHLVDLDPAAVAQAVRRQGVEASAKIRLHAPVDLTGIADALGSWRGWAPATAEIDSVIRQAADAPHPALGGPFEVVLSPCILSQIVGYARDALGRSHPRCADLRVAVRQRHLRLIVDLLTPGGSGLIVSDLATAGSAQARAGPSTSSSHALEAVMKKAINRRDAFAGLDPDAVQAGLRNDPRIGPLVGDIRLIRPWLWTLGPEKAFLVYALRLRRAAGTLLIEPRCQTRGVLGLHDL